MLIKTHQPSVCSIYDNIQHVTLFYFKKEKLCSFTEDQIFCFCLFVCLQKQSPTEPYFNPSFLSTLIQGPHKMPRLVFYSVTC